MFWQNTVLLVLVGARVCGLKVPMGAWGQELGHALEPLLCHLGPV